MQRSGGGGGYAAMHVGIDDKAARLVRRGSSVSKSMRREWQPIASRLVAATTVQDGPASEDNS